jgi:hypothetical protein
MSTTVTLTIGPDDNGTNSVDWGLTIVDSEGNRDHDSSDGRNGSGPRSRETNAWLAYARRHVPAPVINGQKLRWIDATVRPFGWSQGAGHAPNGITITWEIA